MSASDRWQKTMYDSEYAQDTLDSADFKRRAGLQAIQLMMLLGLKKGDRVLDIPCGSGRHAVELAKQGLEVTAVDINPLLLKLARKNQGSRKLVIEKGDMSQLSKYRRKFDAVVNLFTSFGYFSSEKKNEQVLRELVSALKPGGKIALDLINRDWLLSVFRDSDWGENQKQVQIDARQYDPETHYLESYRIVIDKKTGRTKSNFHRIRLYSSKEMVALMKRCGLRNIRVLDGYDGGKFSVKKSSHPVYIGERP